MPGATSTRSASADRAERPVARPSADRENLRSDLEGGRGNSAAFVASPAMERLPFEAPAADIDEGLPQLILGRPPVRVDFRQKGLGIEASLVYIAAPNAREKPRDDLDHSIDLHYLPPSAFFLKCMGNMPDSGDIILCRRSSLATIDCTEPPPHFGWACLPNPPCIRGGHQWSRDTLGAERKLTISRAVCSATKCMPRKRLA